jgi:hypothetical protein
MVIGRDSEIAIGKSSSTAFWLLARKTAARWLSIIDSTVRMALEGLCGPSENPLIL